MPSLSYSDAWRGIFWNVKASTVKNNFFLTRTGLLYIEISPERLLKQCYFSFTYLPVYYKAIMFRLRPASERGIREYLYAVALYRQPK
jgi:hypothetical protein